MQVLHCIYDDPGNPWVGGGGAVRVRELYRRLGDVLEVTVATGNYPRARDEERDGIRYRRLGEASPYWRSRWSYARAATRLLQRAPYAAAVFDFSVYTPIRIPRARAVGITVHHLTAPTARQRWGRAAGGALAVLERRMLRRARWLSATSAATQQELRRLVGTRATICPVGAGVADELFGVIRQETDYLLYFGRLDFFQKGLDTLLEALARLVAKRAGLELRIAGRGKDRARVQAFIRSRGITDNVRLLGEVSEAEKLELLAGARLLVMPSRFEGFGMVAAEAMAAGVPVVATAVDSLPEVVDPPRGGVLVPPADPGALAGAVDRLLDDPKRRGALSRSARRSAERFRWDRVAERHLEFLRLIAAHA